MRMLKLIIVAAAMAIASSAFAAADATLHFTGTILPPSCDIDSTTANQTVNLQQAPVSSFPSVGAVQNATAFNLKLQNCSPSVGVTMSIAGTMDTVPSVLKNTGTATQIGVQILKASSVGATTGPAVTLNSAVPLGTVDATNTMTIPLVAQFYRLGTMTPGSITTTATVTFTYD